MKAVDRAIGKGGKKWEERKGEGKRRRGPRNPGAGAGQISVGMGESQRVLGLQESVTSGSGRTEEGSAWGPGGPRQSAETMDVGAEGPGWETMSRAGGGRVAAELRTDFERRPCAHRGAGFRAGPRGPARVWSAPRSYRGWARAVRARPPAHSEAVLPSHWLLRLRWGGAPLPGKNVTA